MPARATWATSWLEAAPARATPASPPYGPSTRARAFAASGHARINQYEIAKASAAEACAVLDLVDIPGGTDNQQKLGRAP